MNLTEKQSKIIFEILMAFFIALAMSFIMVLINVELINAFFLIWMKSFAVGFIIVVPTSMICRTYFTKIY